MIAAGYKEPEHKLQQEDVANISRDANSLGNSPSFEAKQNNNVSFLTWTESNDRDNRALKADDAEDAIAGEQDSSDEASKTDEDVDADILSREGNVDDLNIKEEFPSQLDDDNCSLSENDEIFTNGRLHSRYTRD